MGKVFLSISNNDSDIQKIEIMRKRITIVYLIDFLATRSGVSGGTEKQLIETINNLDAKRFRPILFCLQEFCPTSLWENTRCEKHILHVYSLFSLHGIKAFFKFVRFLKKESVDIIQTFFFDSILFGITASIFSRRIVSISCRRDMGFWYTKYIIWKLKLLNMITDRIIVNSNAVKQNVIIKESAKPYKINILYNGIDLNKTKQIESDPNYLELLSQHQNKTVIGIVANFNRRVKRVDLFIKAAYEALQANQELIFIIIGEGHYGDDLRKLAYDLGISKNVKFLGKRNYPIKYIRHFDIGVICSDSEGLSNVIIEYMACQIPVIGTAVGGNVELINHHYNGYLVEKNDFKAISHYILMLAKDQNLRATMGNKAYRFVMDRFDWNKSIAQLEDFYTNICRLS